MERFEELGYAYLFFLIPIFLLLARVVLLLSTSRLRQLGNYALLTKQWRGRDSNRFWLIQAVMSVGLVCIVLALMNPQGGTKLEKEAVAGSDVVIALDVSKSMLAQDIAPSRLTKAKKIGQDLIKNLTGHRVALVFFAGDAFVQMPMTADYATAITMIQSADPDMVSSQGSDLGAAIEMALESFEKEKITDRSLIIISDGEEHEPRAVQVAANARQKGLLIHTIGVGTPDGGYIPVQESGAQFFLKDDEGQVVTSVMNANFLNAIAQAGGGVFTYAADESLNPKRIVESLAQRTGELSEVTSFSAYEDRYWWPLFLGLVCIVLAFSTPLSPLENNRNQENQNSIK